MRISHKFVMTLTLSGLAVTGCTSKEDTKVVKEPVATAPTKPQQKPAPTATEDESEKSEKISLRAVVAMIYHLSDPRHTPTEQETKIIQQLKPSPKKGSIEEAALTVVTLRDAIPMGQNTGVVEQEVLSDNKAAPKQQTSTVSVEEHMKKSGIDLSSVLTDNPLLRSYGVYQLTANAVQHSNDSNDYKEKVLAVVSAEVGMWASLQPTHKETVEPAKPAVEKPQQTVFSAGDFRRGDVLLAEAQRLADKGEFKKAIERVGQISAQDPFFGAAKERTRFFSNLAVQDLRQKAAAAFQTALPLTETDSKAGYLERARQYLNDAIQNYPDSDQLQTVRENLAIIVKDLESLGRNPPAAETQSTQ